MKIALVSAFLDDGYGHNLNDEFMENVVCQEDHFYHRIAHSIKMRNHEVTVFYISIEKELKKFKHKYGHEIIRVPAKKIPFFHEPLIYSPTLIEQIEKEFDICHLVSGYYVMYKVPDMFDYIVKKLQNKMPIIARWAGGNHKWLFPIRKGIKKNALKKCNKIICAGKEEISVLKNVFKISELNIEYMINPQNLLLFKKREKQEACKKLGIDDKKNYFLYVGRLEINKGIDNLLEVFKEIESIYPEFKLVLIGDGPLKNEIKKFIKQNKLDEKISLEGRLPHNKIAYYYNASSILFHIGISGGLPNVIIEGVASRIPIIASKNNANIDFVNQELKTGIIINSNDNKELKKSIEKIINNPEKFTQGIPEKIKELSYERFGERLEKIFEECLNGRKDLDRNR
jgi:glycosyltransferase involved in cell wall biosynthesis